MTLLEKISKYLNEEKDLKDFEVIDTEDNFSFGVFRGETAEDALDDFAHRQGSKSFDDLVKEGYAHKVKAVLYKEKVL